MRILLLDFGTGFRGGQRQVLYLARRLAEADGFEPVLGAPRSGDLLARAREAGVETVPLAGRHVWDPRVLAALHLAHRRAPARVIHTNDAKSAALGALVKRVRGAAVALVHTRRVSYALRRATAGKYRVADRVVAVSREIAETVQAAGVLPERVEVVHSGIDPAGYPRARERGARLTFGMVGALTPQKGHAVFLRALAELARRGGAGDWDALVVGDGPLRGEMIELARTLGLSDRVRFAGFVESREALAAMDVLCVPSVDGEGSSGAIKEGWVTGLPVVCSDLASNLELVEPGVSGLAFARGDAEGLADGLARVCLDAGLAERLARAGAGRARAFTDEAMAARYMAIYREIAG